MKFKVGDRVKIVNKHSEELDSRLIGETGTVVEIDDWEYPIEVKYDNEELENLSEVGNLQNLFKEEDLELIENTMKKVRELPTGVKIAYIRDAKRRKEFDYTGEFRAISTIDLENGVNRLTLIGFEIEELVEYIRTQKHSQVVFDVHDRDFKNNFIKSVNATANNFGFKIKENGVIEWETN